MTPQQLLALALRLLSLALALYSLRYLAAYPSAMAGTNLSEHVFVSYAIGGVLLLVAALIWVFPLGLAYKMIPLTRSANHLKVQPLEAAQVGCSLIGLWVFAIAFPGFVWLVLRGLTDSMGSSFFRALSASDRLELGYYLVVFTFSFVLVFRSDAFARLTLRNPVTAGSPNDGSLTHQSTPTATPPA